MNINSFNFLCEEASKDPNGFKDLHSNRSNDPKLTKIKIPSLKPRKNGENKVSWVKLDLNSVIECNISKSKKEVLFSKPTKTREQKEQKAHISRFLLIDFMGVPMVSCTNQCFGQTFQVLMKLDEFHESYGEMAEVLNLKTQQYGFIKEEFRLFFFSPLQ